MKFTVLLLAPFLATCGAISSFKKEKNNTKDEFSYFEAESLDKCISDPEHCLVAVSLPEKIDGINLVRFLRTSEIFTPISFTNIPNNSKYNFEAAANVSTINALKQINEYAKKYSEKIEDVYVDAYCNHPNGSHGGFYRKNFGTDEVILPHSICLGITYHETLGPIPIALDKTVVAHEYFHVVFSEFFSKTDELQALSFENHDLDALNEGLADYFAQKMFGEYSSWYLTENNLTWRGQEARFSLRHNHEFFNHIYKDGQRWVEFLSILEKSGVDGFEVVVCSLENLSTKSLKSLEDLSWRRVVNRSDILESFKSCLEKNPDAYEEAKQKIFTPVIDQKDLFKKAEVHLVGVTNAKAFCEFEKAYKLSGNKFKKYTYINGCDNITDIRFKGQNLSFAPELLSENPNLNKDIIYVLPSLKLDGYGLDCRLRGHTGYFSEVLLGSDATDELNPFINLVPISKRGSSYRDVPFGDFLDNTSFKVGGPLNSIENDGFRFVSYEGRDLSFSGFDGFTFLPNFLVNPNSKEEQNTNISKRLKGIFEPYYRNNDGAGCTKGSDGCREMKNFFIECSGSHFGEKSESGLVSPILIDPLNTTVSIFDCDEKEDGKCSLKSYL